MWHLFEAKVYDLVKRIPYGKVTTYKEIAMALGNKGYARAVGNALKRNNDLVNIPCFKVIRSNGRINGYNFGNKEKIKRLKKEGIMIKNNRVELGKYLYKFT